jgi:hypothetical protein
MTIPLTKRPVTAPAGFSPGAGLPQAKRAAKPPFKFVIALKKLFQKLRHWKTYVPENAVTYEQAASQFLSNVMGVTSRTLPAWQRLVESGLAEQNAVLDGAIDIASRYPLDDLYFAGFVALEASRLPALYGPDEADTVICAIADQLDAAAQRRDRLLSDMFFEVLARLNLMNPAEERRPYDKIVKVILRRLDFDQTEAGQMLLADKGFRHLLAEPFAIYAPQWWEKFKARFVLYNATPTTDDDQDEQAAMALLIAKTEAARIQPKAQNPFGRQWRKRATALFGS